MVTRCADRQLRHLFAGIVSISTIALSSVAHAEGWYAGVGFGQSTADIDLACDLNITCNTDDTDSGWKLFAGNKFSPNAAVEFGYLDLGEAKMSGTDSIFGAVSLGWETTGFNVAFVGFLPVGNSVNLLGKFGLFMWDQDVNASINSLSGSSSESGTDMMFGLGASFDIGQTTAIRIEWERFMDVGENDTGQSDIDLLSASLVFRFR